MIDHAIKFLKPYGLGPYVSVVIKYTTHAEWFLYGMGGELLEEGHSAYGCKIGPLRQALINSAAVARRRAKKEAPVLFNTQPKFDTTIPEGKPIRIFD